MSKKRHGKKKKALPFILFFGILFVLLASAAAFLYFMKIERVEVTGNTYSDRETVIGRLFKSEDDYRLYRVLWKQFFGVEEKEAFLDCRVRLTGIQSAEVTVTETEAVLRIKAGDSNIFLNRNGIVLGEGAGNVDELLEIRGFTILSGAELEPLIVNDSAGLKDGIAVIEALRSENIKADSVEFVPGGTFRVVIGDVTVNLGTTENLRPKAAELAGQIPAFQGLSGIMHLEHYTVDGEKNGFYFEVIPKETE